MLVCCPFHIILCVICSMPKVWAAIGFIFISAQLQEKVAADTSVDCHDCQVYLSKEDKYTANSNNVGLTEVPKCLPQGTSILLLRYNNISRLVNDSFTPFSDLEEIDLYGNPLNVFHPHSFFGLFNLQKLDIGYDPKYGPPTILPHGLFADLYSLSILKMVYRTGYEINGTLTDLISLQDLSISS